MFSYPTANRSKEEGRKHLIPLRDLAREKKGHGATADFEGWIGGEKHKIS
jgi:hypothetical protein